MSIGIKPFIQTFRSMLLITDSSMRVIGWRLLSFEYSWLVGAELQTPDCRCVGLFLGNCAVFCCDSLGSQV